jgi:hypothetical protein
MSEGKNRNKLCPCGSGKKYKKCCMDKKKRITSVTMDMGEPVIINGYKVGADGSLQLLRNGVTVPPVKANIETLYERTKGSKIINKADIETETLWTDLNSSLLKYVEPV